MCPCVLRALFLTGLLFAVGISGPAADNGPQKQFRTLLVPAFQGADELGTRAANVLALQIYRTFRASDGVQPGEPFGRGILAWDPEPLSEMTFDAALRRALNLDNPAQLILWGRAYTLGDDVVVQTFLTASPVLFRLTKNRHEVWRVEYQDEGMEMPIVLTADLPSSHFAFAPVVLSRAAVKRYRSIPALTIYEDRDFTKPKGQIGLSSRALRFEADAVFMTGEVEGWVPLPDLSDGETEVSIFSGAVFRLLRGDWAGADILLQRVLQMPQLPRSIRIDALLLHGLANEKQNVSGIEWIKQAFLLNPYRGETCRYLVQAEVAALMRAHPQERTAAELKDKLSRCRILFNPNDEWLSYVDAIVSSLE
jgi:hypothetical protein